MSSVSDIGEHTRPRVFRPAPRRSGRRTDDSRPTDLDAGNEMLGKGAEHGTRGRVRSPTQPNCQSYV
jgi:hypothetical protein